MHITDLQLTTTNGWVEISANVKYGSNEARVFVRVPERFGSFVATDYSPFLAAALLPAMRQGVPLEAAGSVSKKILSGTERIQELTSSWGIGFRKVPVVIPSAVADGPAGSGVGLFFSAGVDSFYSLVHSLREDAATDRVTHIIFVHGFDISLHDNVLYGAAVAKVRDVARGYGVELIEVQTNVRAFLEQYGVPWDFGHGAAIATVALALRRGLRRSLAAGAVTADVMRPYGLHPELDPNWSTEALQFVHADWEPTRTEKIAYIANEAPAQQALRVCWRNPNGMYNCGRCEKCLRTMVSILPYAPLDRFPTFPPLNPKLLERTAVIPTGRRYFRQAAELLKQRGTYPEVVAAIERGMVWNERMPAMDLLKQGIRHWVAKVDEKFFANQVFKFLSRRGMI